MGSGGACSLRYPPRCGLLYPFHSGDLDILVSLLEHELFFSGPSPCTVNHHGTLGHHGTQDPCRDPHRTRPCPAARAPALSLHPELPGEGPARLRRCWWLRSEKDPEIQASPEGMGLAFFVVPVTEALEFPGLRRKLHCSPFGKERSCQLIVAH